MPPTSSSIQKNQQQSSLVRLNSKGEIKSISTRPNSIELYATELWETLLEKDTAITYKQALVKTWKLLKYFLALLLFVFLLVVAFIISVWGIGFNFGRQFRNWLDDSEQGHGPAEIVEGLLQIIFLPFQKAIKLANQYIAQYLPEWDPSSWKLFDSKEDE